MALDENKVSPNSPTSESRSMNRLEMVCPLPSKIVRNGSDNNARPPGIATLVRSPIGSQPAPPFQYASPASARPSPLVSKSRSAPSS